MKRIRFGVVGLAAVLMLAGCGGASKASSDTTTYSSVLTGQQIANQAGCLGWTPTEGQVEMYVKESGTCAVDGQQLNVDTFNNKAARDSYLKVAMTFGGTFGEGDLWVIHGDDVAAVTKAVAAASGTML